MHLTHRLQFIKMTVLLGLVSSVLLSFNLWAGERWFPKAPLFSAFFIDKLQAPYDYLYLVIFIALVCACFLWEAKLFMWLVILFACFLCMEDQNRLQPWFFNYILILGVLLFYKKRVDEPNNFISVFISLQILVSLIYVFSGLQKCNSFFVPETWAWFINSLEPVLSNKQYSLLYKFGYIVPYTEIAIGLLLLVKPLRFIALPLVVIMHIIILCLLGPFGKSYNYVVWPWNLIMILLNLLLFTDVKLDRFFDMSILFKDTSFYVVITLMLILPTFSFKNQYDSYLSSSLYSGNTHGCKLILSDSAYAKLPYYIKAFTSKNVNYNTLHVKQWALTELNTPCVPEYRVFSKVREHIIHITQSAPSEVKIEFKEREKLFWYN